MCKKCQPGVETGEHALTSVCLPGHTRDERPFWRNEKPLRPEQALDPFQMPLSEYPLIDDFEVVVEWWMEPPQSGEEVPHASARLVSPSRGYLTRALNVDLLRSGFRIPQGSVDHPFHLEAGWDTLETLLAEDHTFVYILVDHEAYQLDEKGNRISLYHAWFKVEKSRYDQQWEQALFLARWLPGA